MEDDDNTFFLLVPAEGAGARLDKFLAVSCADLSRSRLKALIQAGDVTCNGVVCRDPAAKMRPGDAIAITVPPPVEDTPRPENIPLDVVYEDEALLVINKQAGLVVHPGAGNREGTLVNALLYHCGESLSGIGGVRRPGIVHRLDKDTSGLMIVAKTDAAHQALAAQLADRSLSRRYLALVWGAPRLRTGTIEAPIARHATNRLKMAVTAKNARIAVTHYTVLETFGGGAASLVSCKLETGRTHQIRVHMQHLGFPLIGDPLYGLQQTAARAMLKKGGYETAAQVIALSFPRQALHACGLAFVHPLTDNPMTFDAPPPEDLETLVSYLKQV
ncbi:MAG: RluA family pseudouridine synthase [Alphaproteobacteria bacterium]|nr:RluA family pseudouridine synthase [Alphaproteobacteria bacterium]